MESAYCTDLLQNQEITRLPLLQRIAETLLVLINGGSSSRGDRGKEELPIRRIMEHSSDANFLDAGDCLFIFGYDTSQEHSEKYRPLSQEHSG